MDIMPTGDIDHDFVEIMVPHHQGAIDMAVAVLRHGRNERLRRLAQEIVVTQQQEIAAMRLALDEPLPPSAASPTRGPSDQERRKAWRTGQIDPKPFGDWLGVGNIAMLDKDRGARHEGDPEDRGDPWSQISSAIAGSGVRTRIAFWRGLGRCAAI